MDIFLNISEMEYLGCIDQLPGNWSMQSRYSIYDMRTGIKNLKTIFLN